ncbi:MAG: hypothetical protein JJT99_12475 [Rhodobacteraceae bacterium]|nr:hypothetical protein [Paracoccaceae bacterium]
MGGFTELVAALIGALSALAGHMASGYWQQRKLNEQLKLERLRLALDAEKYYLSRKLDALVSVRDNIQQLSDGDISALDCYFKVRPYFIFLTSRLRELVEDAISACTEGDTESPSKEEEDRKADCISSALKATEKEAKCILEKYNEQTSKFT